MHRLAQQHFGVFLADDARQSPGAVRQDDAVDFQFLLDGGQKLVKGVDRLAGAGDGGEGPFGAGHVLVFDGLPDGVGAVLVGRQVGWLHGSSVSAP